MDAKKYLIVGGSSGIGFEIVKELANRGDEIYVGSRTSDKLTAVEGLCNRLGRDLDEAVALAETSPDGLVVTSRCAVFAKSELTHYANEGVDHGRLFRGLFEGVARNVYALFDRIKVDGPVLLVGHGALIAPLVRYFEVLAGMPVAVPAEAGVFEALGALHDLVATGGPAAGACGVTKEIAPFLPTPTVEFDGTNYYLDYNRPQSIGKIRPWYGVAPNLLKAYAWIMSLGADGCRATAPARGR